MTKRKKRNRGHRHPSTSQKLTQVSNHWVEVKFHGERPYIDITLNRGSANGVRVQARTTKWQYYFDYSNVTFMQGCTILSIDLSHAAPNANLNGVRTFNLYRVDLEGSIHYYVTFRK